MKDNVCQDPVVLRCETSAPRGAREVVYLHGRGSDEREVDCVLPLLGNANVCSYRGPVRDGAGFAWFERKTMAVADPISLAEQLGRVGDWIGASAHSSSKPILCGFSNGAAMAGSLMLANPERYSGLIMIGGCLAVSKFPPGRLAGKPVLFCRGRNDMVIPRGNFEATRSYLAGPSRAKATYIDFDGGHEVPLHIAGQFHNWFLSLKI